MLGVSSAGRDLIPVFARGHALVLLQFFFGLAHANFMHSCTAATAPFGSSLSAFLESPRLPQPFSSVPLALFSEGVRERMLSCNGGVSTLHVDSRLESPAHGKVWNPPGRFQDKKRTS